MVASLPTIRPLGAWREGLLAKPRRVHGCIDLAARPAGTTTDEAMADAQHPGNNLLALRTAPPLARAEVGFADVQSEDRAKIANFDRLVDHAIEKVQRGRFL